MSFFSNLIVPLVLCAVFLGALVQRVDLLSAFARGVREGLQVAQQKIHPHGHGWSVVNNVDQWSWS